jgi:transposase
MSPREESWMPRPYPEEFRRRAVELARLREKPVSRIAADLGIAQSCLHRWLRQADIDEGHKEGLTSDERAELVRLRRANRTLEMENEILKRAAVNSRGQRNTIRIMTEVCGGEDGPAGDVGCETETAVAIVGGWEVVQRDLALYRASTWVDLHGHQTNRRIYAGASSTTARVVDAGGA